MIGIIFALLCAIIYALSQLTLRKSYSELAPSVAFFFDALFGLLIWLPLAYFMGIAAGVDWRQALIFAIISAVLSEALVFYALQHGDLGPTTTVLATYSVYTVIFSRLLNNEILSAVTAAFVGLTIFGSILVSAPTESGNIRKWLNRKILIPFVVSICIGFSDAISKGYINRSGDFSFLFALGLVQIPVAMIYLKIEKQSALKSLDGILKKFNVFKFALIGGLFNIVATGFLWLSFFFSPASIVSPITGTNGVFTALFARVLLNERLPKVKYIGMALAIMGIVGIALTKK